MSALTILQSVLAILVTLGVLIQHRAAGLSATFGGVGMAYVQRRGAERVIYRATAWLAAVFFGLGVVRWYV